MENSHVDDLEVILIARSILEFTVECRGRTSGAPPPGHVARPAASARGPRIVDILTVRTIPVTRVKVSTSWTTLTPFWFLQSTITARPLPCGSTSARALHSITTNIGAFRAPAISHPQWLCYRVPLRFPFPTCSANYERGTDTSRVAEAPPRCSSLLPMRGGTAREPSDRVDTSRV